MSKKKQKKKEPVVPVMSPSRIKAQQLKRRRAAKAKVI